MDYVLRKAGGSGSTDFTVLCLPRGSSKQLQRVFVVVLLNSPSKDGPGIMYILHTMSPHVKRRKLHQGITKNTLAEAS
jgi:hypothetical protein